MDFEFSPTQPEKPRQANAWTRGWSHCPIGEVTSWDQLIGNDCFSCICRRLRGYQSRRNIKSSTYPLDFHQNVRHVCWRMNSNDEPVYSPELDGTWMVKPCPRWYVRCRVPCWRCLVGSLKQPRYAGSYAPGLLSSPTRELALFLYSTSLRSWARNDQHMEMDTSRKNLQCHLNTTIRSCQKHVCFLKCKLPIRYFVEPSSSKV